MKMSFTSENRAATFEKFPKLSLEKGESARVVVFEAPHAAFVHNLRAPKIVNGEIQYVRDQNGKQVMDYEFIGNPICLGAEDNLKKNGMDVRNCPACKAVSEHGIDMFQAPKLRYAMHVFQYNTNGTAKAPNSFEGSVKIWAFAPSRFNEILDINETLEGTPLGDVDLLLGPCEAKNYQKYKMLASRGQAAYLNLGAKERFEQICEDNKSKDIYQYIGRKMGKDFMEDKVAEVVRKYNQSKVLSGEARADSLSGGENLDAGLAGLLDSDTPSTPAPQATATKTAEPDLGGESFDDILSSLE